MFDIGFSEMLVIAVVALVVIGPERLPTVARTLGALFGRLNRYVSDVKADVEREMRLEEMKKLRAEVEQQAMSIEQSVVREMEDARSAVAEPANEVKREVEAVADELRPVTHAKPLVGTEMEPVLEIVETKTPSAQDTSAAPPFKSSEASDSPANTAGSKTLDETSKA